MKKRTKIFSTFALLIALTVGAAFIDIPSGPDIALGNFTREVKVHLGLDLQGGTQLVYKADLSQVDPGEHNEALEGVRDVIERRVNAFGVSEPVVQTSSSGNEKRLIVELAGVTDVNEAIDLIGQTPLLEFREPAEQAEQQSPEELQAELESIDPNDEAALQDLLTRAQPEFKKTELTGAELDSARVDFDPNTGEPLVSLNFNSQGRELFADITERNIGKQVAIYLDGSIISAPVVNTAITNGQAVITGGFSIDEAKDLAQRLNAGALPVPIELLSQQTVGASLGQVSVEQSFLAGLIGIILTALFMIVFYRVPGVLSVIALAFYALIILALFKLIPITLTLAGIAGFILSIGMAVDANVLIFERIKEVLRSGRGVREAIEEGFTHAWPSIRDSNVSTLISCVILAWFGTSIVQGFAITLGLGVLVSMFSAIVVTKTLMRITAMTPASRAGRLFNGPKKLKEEDNA